MSKVRHHHSHTLRFTSVLVVLLGATTFVGACNSGDATSNSESSDGSEQVAIAPQGLDWKGGCVCVASSADCPSTTIGNPCRRPPERLECEKFCDFGRQVACYVEADGTSCGLKIGSTCDGGYCGKCPTCYLKNGLCAAELTTTTCGSSGDYCKSCNDGNACTVDTCVAGGCSNVLIPNGDPCVGGSGTCYGGVCCTGCMFKGSCVAGTEPVACGIGGTDCKTCPAPTNPCMRVTCKSGTCGEEPWPLGTSCADSTVCNGNETCDGAGTCLKGTELDCRTGDPCIVGSCDPTLGCVKNPASNTTACSDGNECTVPDLCNGAGSCVPGSPRNCNDNKVCTTDSCDPLTGACLNANLPNDTTCDDGAVCTSGDKCVDGACVGGGLNCDDGHYCTYDSVDCSTPSEPKCVNDPAPRAGVLCPPADKCVDDATCVGTECVPNEGSRINCDDGNPCTIDTCESARGCVRTNADATTVCNDGNPCTVADHCDPSNGTCTGSPNVCAPSDDCHHPGTCDPATGKCGTEAPRNDGDPCMSGSGQCVGGACEVLAPAAAGAAGAAGFAGEWSNAGTAGVASLNGGTASTTVAVGGSGNVVTTGGTSGVVPGTTTSIDPDDLYKPDPGGCNCALPRSSANHGLALIGLLGLALGRLRKRRD